MQEKNLRYHSAKMPKTLVDWGWTYFSDMHGNAPLAVVFTFKTVRIVNVLKEPAYLMFAPPFFLHLLILGIIISVYRYFGQMLRTCVSAYHQLYLQNKHSLQFAEHCRLNKHGTILGAKFRDSSVIQQLWKPPQWVSLERNLHIAISFTYILLSRSIMEQLLII